MIEGALKLRRDQMRASLLAGFADQLEKGGTAEIGEIRTFGKHQYRKFPDGWHWVKNGVPTATAYDLHGKVKQLIAQGKSGLHEPLAHVLDAWNKKGKIKLTEADITHVCGVEPNSEMKVGVFPSGQDSLMITINHPDYTISRKLLEDGRVENMYLELARGQENNGKGTALFAKQVEFLRSKGVSEMITEACRSDEMNGYYTWPRLGYEPLPRDWSKIESTILQAASYKEFPLSIKVLPLCMAELMETEDGRNWWKERGFSVTCRFNLSPTSNSSITLVKYIEAKAKEHE